MIKQFKDDKNKYWVNGNPYMVVGIEIKPMTSIYYKEDVEILKKYLKI